MSDIYIEHGYTDRQDYLTSLADEYDIPYDVVFMAADLLGPDEDFDGLVTLCQDCA